MTKNYNSMDKEIVNPDLVLVLYRRLALLAKNLNSWQMPGFTDKISGSFWAI
jgi:hypothetical protein